MCYKVKPSESSRPSNEKWEEEEESDYDEYDDDGALVSQRYSTMNS